MKIIKLSVFAFLLFTTFGLVKAEDKKIVSPDGKLAVTVVVDNGIPKYSILYNGKVFLQQSPLGLNTKFIRSVGDCVVNQEATGFVFPQGTTTCLTAQSKAMVGFARTMPSYEIPYTVDAKMGENGQGNGYTFPCLFKVNDNGWVLISETGVDSRCCGGKLIGHADGLYTIGFPMDEENNGNGTSSPGITTPGETPWRTITVGETLAPIVETTIPFNVVKPRYEASQKYQYTKGS